MTTPHEIAMGLNRERLLELAAKCEAATADQQREMLEAAFRAIHGEQPPRLHGGSDELSAWLGLHNPFFRMLEAEAYESAAMTLKSEGRAIINIAEDGITTAIVDGTEATAFTPALALCAASLRSLANQEDGK